MPKNGPPPSPPALVTPPRGAFDRYLPYVGSTYVTSLTDAKEHAVMVIGTDRWSVARFVADLGVAHLKSGRIITTIAKLHGAKSLRDFYERASPGSVAEVGFGVASLFTLFRAFESAGLDVFRWAHKEGGWDKKATTFVTFKKRAAEQKPQPKRRRRR